LLTHNPTKHRTRRRRGVVVVVVLLGAVCLAGTVALSSAGPAGAYTPAPCGPDATPASMCPFPAHPDKGYPPGQPAYTYNDCLWGYVLNRNNALTNQTGIDANNAYFTALFEMPPHSTIILHGQFPHSRFFSFTTYGTVNGTVGVATSWIFDYQINPDPGSQNPFQPGVRRDVSNRNFTLTISSEVKPDNPAPNTLYAGAAGQTDDVQDVNVTMRFYLPDRLYLPVSPTSNLMGGVAPPTHTIVLANGQTDTGTAMCKAVNSSPGALNGTTFFSSGVPNPLYAYLRHLGPVGHPATRVPEWQKYYNQTQILKPFFQHTRFAFLIPFFYNETPAVSFFPNPANTYLITNVDRRLGPARGGHNVFVMHFKIPTTPETYLGNPGPNDNGAVQARYESLCTYTSPAVATNIQQFEKCLNDQTMLPDRNRMVTIVLSLAQDRPKHARARCRVAWQKLSPYGDNFGIVGKSKELVDPGVLPGGRLGAGTDPYLYGVVIRQQLPNTNFKRSFANIPTNRIIKPFLGPYYPGGRYMTARQFDRTHPCNRR
jgi:hypothetical protein